MAMKHAQIAKSQFSPMFDEIVPRGAVYGYYKGVYYIHYNFKHPENENHTFSVNTYRHSFKCITYKRDKRGLYRRKFPDYISTDSDMFLAIKKSFCKLVKFVDIDNDPRFKNDGCWATIDWTQLMQAESVDFEKLMLDTGAPRRSKPRTLAKESSRQANRRIIYRIESSSRYSTQYDRGRFHMTQNNPTSTYRFHPAYENSIQAANR